MIILADEPENPFGGGFAFPGGFPFGQPQQQETPRGDDIVVPLLVTLEELFLGTKVTLIQTEKSVRDAPGTRDCNCRIEMKTVQVKYLKIVKNLAYKLSVYVSLKFIVDFEVS